MSFDAVRHLLVCRVERRSLRIGMENVIAFCSPTHPSPLPVWHPAGESSART
jgi:hypothetical protein